MEKQIIHKGDFVEVEYTGRIRENNAVFDTTSAEVAKENNVFNENFSYGPVAICISQGHILKSLDDLLEGKEVGREYKFELEPEKAFGKKNPKLLRLIALSAFRKQNITPVPGLQMAVDGAIGTVRSVTGGRVVVDFNHPLAGKNILYDIKALRLVKDNREKLNSLVKMELGLKDFDVTLEENKAKIKLKGDIPKEIEDRFIKKAKELIPIKTIEFITAKR